MSIEDHLNKLQGMINAVVSTTHSSSGRASANIIKLLETGKALRGTDRESGKMPTGRLKGNLPSVTNNFHEALDDLESEIVSLAFHIRRELHVAC